MDFAGYSHLMIGAACLLGFRLQENFDRPFLSTSPSVFWTRWHMSLSFWIRDYVFLPLASVRRGYSDIVDACRHGHLERLPEILHDLSRTHHEMYGKALAAVDGI